MNLKQDRDLLLEAINSGCKTAAQLARFLKAKSIIQNYIPIYARAL